MERIIKEIKTSDVLSLEKKIIKGDFIQLLCLGYDDYNTDINKELKRLNKKGYYIVFDRYIKRDGQDWNGSIFKHGGAFEITLSK
jgi:hypothetical protein